MQHHYPFIVDYTREGQPIWSKFCPKCNSYSDYSQMDDMRYVTRKSKVYEEGRTCSEKGCEVTLSKYNDRTECFAHHKFKQPRVRGRLDARELKS